jgi:hypothetical protein
MSTTETNTMEAEVLSRIIAPDEGTLNPEAARSILQFEFPQADVARMQELAEKNRQGTIAEFERDQMQAYMRIGTMLSLLKSKARRSLATAERN